ncbi:putative peptide/nitrate transporter [Platanthera zijinensis]|uniref:Peptide/nitrate transporter n=1 Tax=Platanthera zijinensis TaxID=2320716 RepID=A0AAP0AY49_9ASPA
MAGNETFEKLGTIGTSANLLVYLTTIFHMNSVTAAMLLQVFSGTTNLAPVLGAFLADTYLGRYFTLGFASIASLMGMLILTLTAAFKTLHPPPCNNGENCASASPLQLSFIFLSFAFLIVGAGGIRPCNLAFGADQFNPHTESGRRGINSFFYWYYFTFTVAVMLSCTVIIYVQSSISWAIGLGIPALLMFFSCSFFFLGSKLYVRVKPEGSPFGNVARVLAAAYRKRAMKLPDEDHSHLLFNPPLVGSTTVSKLPHTDQFRCLDKASILTSSDEVQPEDGKPINPWRLCSSQHVEEVKCIIRILPIWSTSLLYNMAMTQQGTYVVFQALQSDRRLGNNGFQIPAGSFIVFNMLALTIWIPIYDRIVVPRLQRITKIEGGITLLHRMGVGIVIAIVSLLVAAFVEEKRRSIALREFTAPSGRSEVSPMSGLWLIPQLMLCGLSEAMGIIAQIEFYYKQFPENMRSVAGAILVLGFAVSNYFCSFVVMAVHRTTENGRGENWLAGDLNRGRLDLFYLLTAAMAVANLAYFIVCARWYKYKDLKAAAAAEEIPMEVV